MKKTFYLIGSIVLGWLAVLGVLLGSTAGIPAPWYQIGILVTIGASIVLFNKYDRYGRGRVRK